MIFNDIEGDRKRYHADTLGLIWRRALEKAFASARELGAAIKTRGSTKGKRPPARPPVAKRIGLPGYGVSGVVGRDGRYYS